MTDKEIINALECHLNPDPSTCSDCPLFCQIDCAYYMSKNALDLINRQQAEIDRLQNMKKKENDK